MTDILTSVFERISRRLHSSAARILDSGQDADDALQEAFVRLWQRRDSFAGECHAEGAAVATVKNICIDELRRRSTHRESELSDSIEAENDDSADSRALIDRVNALIANELSSRDRLILIMRDRNGYEFDEIAAEFGMTETAVRVALSRARKTIRNLYRTRYGI